MKINPAQTDSAVYRVRLGWLLCAMLFTCPAVLAQVRVDHGVGAGRDINAQNIILKYGLKETEVVTLFEALIEKQLEKYRTEEGAAVQMVAQLGGQLGVTDAAIKRFFEILGEKQVPRERLLEKFAEVAERHIRIRDESRVQRSLEPEVNRLREQAEQVFDVGAYDRAEALLAQAEEAELAAIEQQQAEIRERQLNLAALRAKRGEINLAQLDYLQAAEHFRIASKQVPADGYQIRGDYLSRYADALYTYGDEKGDNAALLEAIKVYHQALEELTRERVPLDWAATQTNLGLALARLGERESDTARLEQAVVVYRAALEERTRERVPLDWAMTQDNLGSALTRLGEREGGLEHLMEAKRSIHAAHELFKKAGYSHHDAYFENRLHTLDKRLNALR